MLKSEIFTLLCNKFIYYLEYSKLSRVILLYTNDISTIPESFKAVDQTSQVTVLYFVAKWHVVMYISIHWSENLEKAAA